MIGLGVGLEWEVARTRPSVSRPASNNTPFPTDAATEPVRSLCVCACDDVCDRSVRGWKDSDASERWTAPWIDQIPSDRSFGSARVRGDGWDRCGRLFGVNKDSVEVATRLGASFARAPRPRPSTQEVKLAAHSTPRLLGHAHKYTQSNLIFHFPLDLISIDHISVLVSLSCILP